MPSFMGIGLDIFANLHMHLRSGDATPHGREVPRPAGRCRHAPYGEPMFKEVKASEDSCLDSVKVFIAEKSFPCVGAKSALNKDRMRLVRFGAMADPASTQALWKALIRYSQ